ncbi:MAG: hypothetical protein EOM50_22585 [Erysipelotrichia bacterium]|nr:hypothetical protein [Erysipelotrichia bacterium]
MEELTTLDVLTISLVIYVIGLVVSYIFKQKWLMIASSVLWFVPIFLVDNTFIVVFSIIMIVAQIVIVAFSSKGDDEFL